MLQFLAVGIGGFIGSCVRYGISREMSSSSHWLPFGTLISNVIAGLLVGFFMVLKDKSVISPQYNLMLTTGFLGGLSTFSTFSLETDKLILNHKYFFATLNITLNLGFSLVAVLLGMWIAGILVKKI